MSFQHYRSLRAILQRGLTIIDPPDHSLSTPIILTARSSIPGPRLAYTFPLRLDFFPLLGIVRFDLLLSPVHRVLQDRRDSQTTSPGAGSACVVLFSPYAGRGRETYAMGWVSGLAMIEEIYTG